jgi:hypothetical protein
MIASACFGSAKRGADFTGPLSIAQPDDGPGPRLFPGGGGQQCPLELLKLDFAHRGERPLFAERCSVKVLDSVATKSQRIFDMLVDSTCMFMKKISKTRFAPETNLSFQASSRR